jgi:uncharacterized membrane protein
MKYCWVILFVIISCVNCEEEKKEEEEESDAFQTTVDIITNALQESLRQHANKIAKGHISRINDTVTYVLLHEDTSNYRVLIILVSVLIIAIVSLWCVISFIKTAFRWGINLIMGGVLIFVIFWLFQLISAQENWFSSTPFAGNTN